MFKYRYWLQQRAIGWISAVLVLASSVMIAQTSETGLSAKRIVAIEYPWFARMAVLQGTVELVATISQDGTVHQVRVVSGPEPLAQPSRETLSKWLFTGCHVQAGCDVPFAITFSLSGSCDASEHCPSEFEIDLPSKISVRSKSIRAIAN
jgi:Gram-negative bacterial TonB protein C-terminal